MQNSPEADISSENSGFDKQDGGNGVLDPAKVDYAIHDVLETFEKLGLTIAECIQVVLSIGYALDNAYPGVFKVLRELKGKTEDLHKD